MKVSEIMTENPACCVRGTSLTDVATLMVDNSCGEIPVIDSDASRKLIGVVTDRDIVCRTVAKGINPLTRSAGEIMTAPCLCCNVNDDVEDCCEEMERHQIRRVPIIDDHGRICGIVSQADLARYIPAEKTFGVLKTISRDTGQAHRM